MFQPEVASVLDELVRNSAHEIEQDLNVPRRINELDSGDVKGNAC